jgi:hypothetical protein
VLTTGAGAASQAEDDEEGALALIPMHRPLQKRQKTVRTVSALLLPGDAGGAAASGTHLDIAAVCVQKSPLCTASAAAPLLELEGASEQRRAESPVHAPLAASVIVHASAELEHPIAVGRARARLSIVHPGTATEAPTSGF